MDKLPLVSIIIPCRNEEKYITRCLDSIIANDYPKDRFEILVLDGMSEDSTRRIIKEYTKRHTFINLFDNQKKTTPYAFNKGIHAAKGEVIMIVGSHSMCEKDYISKCVNYLLTHDADNVGGIWKILPQNDSFVSKSIAYALSSPFGAGNAYYKIGSKKPRYVDTVWGGCYKKEVFEKIGFFDEDLIRNQDDEFNLRLIKNGGKILLVPEITTYYYARDSLKKLWSMYSQYGYFKPLVALKVHGVLTWRQLIPAIFVGTLASAFIIGIFSKPFIQLFLLILGVYFVATIAFSSIIAANKGLRYIFPLPVVFATLHFSYGLGYLNGLLDFVLLKKHKKKKIKDVQLTR